MYIRLSIICTPRTRFQRSEFFIHKIVNLWDRLDMLTVKIKIDCEFR